MCRSPSKRYARRTVGACTLREAMLDSRRSTPLLDDYNAGSPVNQSVDSYSQRSASDGRQSISSSTYSPVSRQPVNNWTSHRTNSPGFTASPPNSSDSITKSANPALRSTLPADYKPSGYGTASRTNIRSNSSSSTSIGGERTTRSPATGGDSGRTDGRPIRSSDQNYPSLTRRHSQPYHGSRVKANDCRSSRHYEPRTTHDQSSEWQVIVWIILCLFDIQTALLNLQVAFSLERSFPKQPIMCRVGRLTLHTHSLSLEMCTFCIAFDIFVTIFNSFVVCSCFQFAFISVTVER